MTVLIIEDDLRVSELISRSLKEQGLDSVTAYDGETGSKIAVNNQIDLIIADLILPKLNGIEVCRSVKAVKPDIPIIMLTALGATDDKLEGFDAGADDYMVKPFDFRELYARVRVLIKRKDSVDIGRVVLKVADLEMNLRTKIVRRANVIVDLTPKEFALLEYMMLNSDRVIPRTEIADKVWNTTFDTGTNFIDVYINYLRKKIDKDFTNKLIHTKSGMGFILRDSLI
ncbi:MAG TPA: response regulator transcription factor [Cyclobacteriaceae bacterium]|jgi:DNA-binding response OmpR family regulator|nr:response regulator transcription factor [Cyclobacteriaceae bacterium]